MFRVGNGIDFHKLIHEPFRPLILAGVEVKSEFAFLGHSDADVVLHAVADAILGALALGDIGVHFPDTDPQYKNMKSTRIIEKCLELMAEEKIQTSEYRLYLCGRPSKNQSYSGRAQCFVGEYHQIAVRLCFDQSNYV